MKIEYSKDIAQPPAHLDLKFFEDVVENALRQSTFKIHKIHFSMGSKTGENYCSEIYRVQITYSGNNCEKLQNLSLIIKSILQTEATDFLIDLDVFIKEKVMYRDVLPRLEMLLPDGAKFGARLYFSIKEPIKTLVFEDLCAKGFEVASRELGLDETHARLVLQKLAQFHATSMVLAKKDPEIMESFHSGLLGRSAIDRDNSMLLRYFGGEAEALVDAVSQWQGYEKITQKLKTYVANLRDNLSRCQDPLPNDIKVLNHGDMWVNNMLFKYDKQRTPQDIAFIDLQMSIWSSPGIDLNYFFYTSLRLDVLKHKREELLMAYHSSLCSTLQKLNYLNIPSYQQIKQEVKKRTPYGFFAQFGIYPTISMDKDISADNSLDSFNDEEFAKTRLKQMFSSKRLEEMMKYTLIEFDQMKILD